MLLNINSQTELSKLEQSEIPLSIAGVGTQSEHASINVVVNYRNNEITPTGTEVCCVSRRACVSVHVCTFIIFDPNMLFLVHCCHTDKCIQTLHFLSLKGLSITS